MNWRGLVAGAALVLVCVSRALADVSADIDAASKATDAEKYDEAIGLTTHDLAGNHLQPEERANFLAIRGKALVRKNQFADAERDFADALRIAPDRDARKTVIGAAAGAYAGLAHTLYDAEKWDDAAANFAIAANYDPGDEDNWLWQARAHVASTEFDKAIEESNRLIAIDNTASNAYLLKASAEELKFDYDDALIDYGTAIRIDPRHLGALAWRGRLYVMLGQYDLARQDLDAALSVAPDDVSAVMWMHILHMKTKEDDAAWLKRTFAKLDANEWPAPALAYFLGKKTGDQIVDIALHGKKTIHDHQRCDAWFYLGENALRQGDKNKADALFQRTVKGCTAEDFEWDAAAAELRPTPE